MVTHTCIYSSVPIFPRTTAEAVLFPPVPNASLSCF